MLKIKKMVDQETRENILDSNPYFSPIFCGYPPNNWCGIVPLWASLHLGDQSKHGHKAVPWLERTECPESLCNKFPQIPRHFKILELHHKSNKRTVFSSSKERIDNLIACLVEWKEAKRRAYNAQVTRSKEGQTKSCQQWEFQASRAG